tara:strand:+ start:753 stop:1166 length:414 start_codon:yes stop_codon:yes gene_type:complete
VNISEISNIENLEASGTVTELRQQLQEMVFPLRVEAESYEDLFKVVLLLQKKWIDDIKGPFVSRKAEFIFYLTKLDGEKRNDLLGLTEEHFRDPALAKKWYRSLVQLIHSDRDGSDEAFLELQKVYRIVSFVGDEDE